LIYYRDPLLDKICDRILDLGEPAFIKNSELVYVAVNEAFANLFNVEISDLVGTKGDSAELEALLDIEDKERACVVFGEDQLTSFADPFGKGRFRVEMERFTLADGQTFLYCVFNPFANNAGPEQAPHNGPAKLPQDTAAVQTGSGKIDSMLAEQLIDTLSAGICIYDRDNNLVYFNQKLDDYYGELVGGFRLGMNLRDVIAKLADAWIAVGGEKGRAIARDREKWIAERLAFHDTPYSSDVLKLSSGRWIHNTNRRLADGTLIGLRVDVTDMKERERLLEQHIQEVGIYRELLNRLPVAAFARGPDQRLAFVNQAYVDLFGRSYNSLIGTTEMDLLGEHAGPIWDANHNTLVNGAEYEAEEETPVAGGRLASTIVKTGRLITENGTPYVVGTVIDISSIHQRELLLKRANDQAEAIRQDFENIIASIDVGLIVLDKDLNIQLVNDAYRKRIWGKGAERWQGEIIGHNYRELLRNNYLAGRQPEMFDDFEVYYEHRVAEIRSGTINTREVVFSDGAVTLYSGIKLSGGKFLLCYVDLTELRKRDKDVAVAHREAEHAYQLVLSATDTMPEGLMVIEDGRIALTNRSLAQLLNVSEDLLETGRSWRDVFLETSRQNSDVDEHTIEQNLARFHNAIEVRKDISYNFPLDGERWVHVEMRHKNNGQSVVICSDLTEVLRREVELKRLIAKAEAADRAKSEFLANMSLEIRTPMNGILGMAELLAKSALDTRQKAFIDIIMKSGNALMTIINDILDFSKLDAGHVQLKYASFDPGEALEDVASLFASAASEKNIELVVMRSGKVPAMIMGDAGRFRQIVTNLVSNAVKFTEQGLVSASIGAVADHQGHTVLSVVVEDTGIGIQADKLGHVFEKFSQVDIGSSRREGAGLGLAIAHRLASIQGGTLSVHSTEGKGSTFTFSLPVQVAADTNRQKPLPVNVEGARILIVDDHEVTRSHLLENAGEWGFDCVGAADAATALSILDAAADSGVEVDAVIIDCQMPEMNGMEMARHIRSDSRFDTLAIILLTSQDIASFEQMVADIKIEAYLTKPIRIPLLRNTLVDVIRSGRAHDPVPSFGRTVRPRAAETRLAPSYDETPAPAAFFAGSEQKTRDEAVTIKSYVLVAEDNDVNQIFFSQILEAAGLDYRIVENGQAAVDAWRQAAPSVILMDTTLPGLDGFEATRKIRAFEATVGMHTPIIGVITHLQEKDAERCIASGMDDHIAKPVSPERLEEKIRHWTGDDVRATISGLHPV
jgi:PAS domain S-box-containing protein